MLKKISAIPLWYIILFNLVLKLVVFCYISPWDKTVAQEKIVVSDAIGYEKIALTFLKYHSFAPPVDTASAQSLATLNGAGSLFYHIDAIRTPGYPVFIAMVYSVFGAKPFMVILFQILLSLIILGFIYRMCLLLFDNKGIAIIACLLYSFDIHSIYVANELLADTIFTLFFTASVYYLIKGIKENWTALFIYSAVFMGLAAITKPVALLYPAVGAFIIFIFWQQPLGKKIKAIVIYGLIFAVLPLSWSVRNYSQYGNPLPSAQAGDNALYSVVYTKARLTHGNADSIKAKFQLQADSLGFMQQTNPFKKSDIYSKVGLAYIKQHKGAYLLTHLLGGLNIFISIGNIGMAETFGWTNYQIHSSFAELSNKRLNENLKLDKRATLLGIIILLVMFLQYAGAAYGTIVLAKQRNYFFLVFVVLTILYIYMITGSVGMYRYKLPLVPYICIVAACGYNYLLSKKGTA